MGRGDTGGLRVGATARQSSVNSPASVQRMEVPQVYVGAFWTIFTEGITFVKPGPFPFPGTLGSSHHPVTPEYFLSWDQFLALTSTLDFKFSKKKF